MGTAVDGGDETPKSEVGTRELFAVLLMALTSVLTAWSAYEASVWGGEASDLMSMAAVERAESLRESDRGNQEFITDTALFSDWLNAIGAENDALADFYEDRFPEEFAVAFDAWIAQDPFNAPGADATPFELEEYSLASDKRAVELEDRAEARAAQAREAGDTGDRYTLTTVISTVVLLLAGISTKVRADRSEVALLGVGSAIFVVTAVVVATFPRIF